jgi:hypothetical protein
MLDSCIGCQPRGAAQPHTPARTASAVELTPAGIREIESASSAIPIHGARYPEHSEKMIGL